MLFGHGASLRRIRPSVVTKDKLLVITKLFCTIQKWFLIRDRSSWKISIEIGGPHADKSIGLVRRAYAFEMQTSYFFQYVANDRERIQALFEDFLELVQRSSPGLQ